MRLCRHHIANCAAYRFSNSLLMEMELQHFKRFTAHAKRVVHGRLYFNGVSIIYNLEGTSINWLY